MEDLVRTVQLLPTNASAVEAIQSGLAYLDSRAAAALLKGLSKAGQGQRAVEIFDYLRSVRSVLAAVAKPSSTWDINKYTAT